MTATHPRIAEFAAQLRRIAAETSDEEQIIARVRPLMKALCDDPDWVDDDYYRIDEAQGVGMHLLHEEADHSLAVFAISWRPGRSGPPHDHGTWAVVGGVAGHERNITWRRAGGDDAPGYCTLERGSEFVAGPGDVVSFLSGDIHSVDSEGDRVTLSLHVYGMHTNFTDRYKYDPETGKMERDIMTIEGAAVG